MQCKTFSYQDLLKEPGTESSDTVIIRLSRRLTPGKQTQNGHGAGMALSVKNTIKSSTTIGIRLPGHVFFLPAKYG